MHGLHGFLVEPLCPKHADALLVVPVGAVGEEATAAVAAQWTALLCVVGQLVGLLLHEE